MMLAVVKYVAVPAQETTVGDRDQQLAWVPPCSPRSVHGNGQYQSPRRQIVHKEREERGRPSQ